MGAVYEAVDTRLGNTVALKETLVRGGQLDEAFAREARLLSALRHPALPVVSDYFAEGNGHFLVMQFIPGTDLGNLMTQRSITFDFGEGAALVREIARCPRLSAYPDSADCPSRH
jgi:serine/threonine protein kinase